MRGLMVEPKTAAKLVIAVAVNRWCSGNQIEERTGGAAITTGPAAPLIAWPMLINLKNQNVQC